MLETTRDNDVFFETKKYAGKRHIKKVYSIGTDVAKKTTGFL